MASVNKAILIGRLGKDVETKKAKDTLIARFSLATSEKYKDEEKTTWHTVVVFGKTAEHCKKYLSKGSLVYVEGKIDNRSYEKDGEKKYVSEIVALNVRFLGSKKEEKSESNNDDSWG